MARTDQEIVNRLLSACAADPDLQKLASAPLTLAILANVYERTGNLPRRKADVVARYLDAVLETWDASRGIRRYAHDLLKEEKSEALSLIAWATWNDHRTNFTNERFCSLQNSWSPLRHKDSAKRILRDSGLFVLSKKGLEWEFGHELFRDYLCALYLVARPDDIVAAIKLNEEGSLRLWRYACGITADASRLLEAVATNANIPQYQKARWLLLALNDGITAPSKELQRVIRDILDSVETEASGVDVSEFEMSEAMWRLTLCGSGPRIEAFADIISILLSGGWSRVGSWNIDIPVAAQSPVTKAIARLLHRSWAVKKVNDPAKQTVSLIGSRGSAASDE
jgi:hypothetical protein